MDFKVFPAIILCGLYLFIILAALITILKVIIEAIIEETALFSHKKETQGLPNMCRNQSIGNPTPPPSKDIIKTI